MYGDTFIAGFVEGGEFSALVSVKIQDGVVEKDIRLQLAAMFDFPAGNDEPSRKAVQGETTIVVSYTSGSDIACTQAGGWTLESLRAAALAFPERAMSFPARTR